MSFGKMPLANGFLKKEDFNKKIYQRMTLLHYLILQFLLLMMLSLPVKIFARLLFRIKYVWVTPWFNV